MKEIIQPKTSNRVEVVGSQAEEKETVVGLKASNTPAVTQQSWVDLSETASRSVFEKMNVVKTPKCKVPISPKEAPQFSNSATRGDVSSEDFENFYSSGLMEIGKWAIPESLKDIFERFTTRSEPNFSDGTIISTALQSVALSTLCAAIHNMDHTRLEDVSKRLLLKWQDAVSKVSFMKFQVDFLWEHLIYITKLWFGLLAE